MVKRIVSRPAARIGDRTTKYSSMHSTSRIRGVTRNSAQAAHLDDMKSKELITVGVGDQEILDFLKRIRDLGSVVVQVGSDRFVIDIRRESITDEGRNFLVRGGPLADE